MSNQKDGVQITEMEKSSFWGADQEFSCVSSQLDILTHLYERPLGPIAPILCYPHEISQLLQKSSAVTETAILDSFHTLLSPPLPAGARKMLSDFSGRHNQEIVLAIAANTIQNKTPQTFLNAALFHSN